MMMFSDIACFLSPDTTIYRQTWRCRAAKDAQLSPQRVTGSHVALSHREQGHTAMARQAGKGREQARKAAVGRRSRSSTTPVVLLPDSGLWALLCATRFVLQGQGWAGSRSHGPGADP